MTIVMGLDQHRGQITGEWLDTDRRAAAHAGGAGGPGEVREFVGRFVVIELEIALEATTGWRFVVQEFRRVGAVVHLAEPAETAGCGGTRSARRVIGRTPGICGSC